MTQEIVVPPDFSGDSLVKVVKWDAKVRYWNPNFKLGELEVSVGLEPVNQSDFISYVQFGARLPHDHNTRVCIGTIELHPSGKLVYGSSTGNWTPAIYGYQVELHSAAVPTSATSASGTRR
ncbi:MAG TPA: hypothetical protein VGF28_03070 [Thermoanaerobaculia bacterium]|jgi:hypothetical protein